MLIGVWESGAQGAILAALQTHVDPTITSSFVTTPLQQSPAALPSGTWTQRIYQRGDDLLAALTLERDDRTYLVLAIGTQEAFIGSINAAVNQVLLGFTIGEASTEVGGEARTGEAATLRTETGDLQGTLQLPEGPGPFPVALIIAGSGPTDRDGNSAVIPGQNNSLRMLAEGLAERGVASLRYDKRGIAASAAAGGNEADLTFDDFVDDAVAWLEQLRLDARFSELFVLGHSEGSLIGMLAAERINAPGFISLAGPGQNAAELLLVQLAPQLPAQTMADVQTIIQELREGREVAGVDPSLAALFRPSVQPYLISWFQYDPAEVLARLEMPVLIVQGTTDIQVAVTEAELLAAAQPAAELVLIEDMNHVLKEVVAGADPMRSYGDSSLPLAPGLLDAVMAFITSVTSSR